MARKRPFLDILVDTYGAYTREQLLAFVVCGEAYAQGERLRDPKRVLPPEIHVELRPRDSGSSLKHSDVPSLPYVSRGGLKIEPALRLWKPELEGRVWLDVGSSTGGFTHALLLAGASGVHAVDVGYNLLDWRLRTCGRVIIHERCNFLDLGQLDPLPFGAVADLSFRSLQGAASRILGLTSGHVLLALIKPQFELEHCAEPARTELSESIGSFDGIIKDLSLIRRIIRDLTLRLSQEKVWIRYCMASPVKGGHGNQEYLAWLESDDSADAPALNAQSGEALGAAGL